MTDIEEVIDEFHGKTIMNNKIDPKDGLIIIGKFDEKPGEEPVLKTVGKVHHVQDF